MEKSESSRMRSGGALDKVPAATGAVIIWEDLWRKHVAHLADPRWRRRAQSQRLLRWSLLTGYFSGNSIHAPYQLVFTFPDERSCAHLEDIAVLLEDKIIIDNTGKVIERGARKNPPQRSMTQRQTLPPMRNFVRLGRTCLGGGCNVQQMPSSRRAVRIATRRSSWLT